MRRMDAARIETYARVAAAALLVFGCLLVLRPFVGAILFAGVLCYSTWPAFAWLRNRWKGRSALAALALVLAMVIVLALPVAVAAQSLIVHSADLVEEFRDYIAAHSSIALPEFIGRIPLVGSWLDDYGRRLLQSRDELIAL